MFSDLMAYADLGWLFLRLSIGAIFLVHAFPKLKNPGPMAQMMGKPSAMVLALGTVETVSALGLILGLYMQPAAALLALVMVGAIALKLAVWKAPFSSMTATGWEFDLILLAGNVAILLGGGGDLGLG